MRTLGRGFRDRGIQMGVCAIGTGTPYGKEWYESEGIATYQVQSRIPKFRHVFSPANWRATRDAIRSLNAVVDEFQPDVVHANSGLMAALFSLGSLTTRRSVPLVTCIHGTMGEKSKVALGGLASRLWPGLYGVRSIAISSEMTNYLANTVGIPRRRIRRVLNGVEDGSFRPPQPDERRVARERLGIPDDARVVCLIGQYVPRKGHALLVDALGALRRRGITALMLCAGKNQNDDVYKDDLRRRGRELGVESQLLLFGHRDAQDIYWASDIAALPSLSEGAPLVVPEAMLSGLVTIRTPTAGVADTTIDGETGFVVPFGDADALADRIQQVLEDPAARKRISLRAVEFALERFSARRMVDETLRVYEEAVAAVR